MALFLLSACTEAVPPAYVRLSGPAPTLAGVPADGAQLLVFWAAWCPPCRQEAPGLRALARDPPQGLHVVTFGRDASLEEVSRFFDGRVPPELNLRLDEGEAATQALGAETLPTSILVVEGRLVARFTGPRKWDAPEMRRLLERLMKERQAPAASAPLR
ncbi:TlpA family protein disulfide reductase [Corallococcus sp. CA047B]|uniref:TlpA family protein disulfide reductase n=1 Tax=Corallococcus sp. CA047B TaxID=2316729 RepID=UPI000EA025AC|nr:TlpA disulfide reductase family protein [Corallococcus sp. CA047B]RKH11608.1 TlpA family protein disulfide reductase [Corallococcus sp. CA047B]